jgi:hypothetical protein
MAIMFTFALLQPYTVPITAQAAKTVSYDTPVEGQITDSTNEEVWTLTALAKDLIQIAVERTEGTLAPNVELRDSNNQRIAGAEVDYSYAKATVQEFTLPAAGTYTVAVGRYSGKDGKTAGNYKLTVALLGAGEDNPILKTPPKPIEYDKPADGEITTGRWMESWTFTAPAKDTVSIAADRKDGTLWPELILLDASGNPVTRASTTPYGVASVINRAKLPGPGAYTVIVKRYGDQGGGNTGKYSLTVSLDSAGAERPDLAKPQGPATLDGAVKGTLTNAKWMDVWSLDAQSKDHLEITMTHADGNLIPEVLLFGANNQEIQRARADETYAAAKMTVNLPGPGKYEIHVQRQDGENGYTTGAYQLSVVVLGTGEDNPKFKTSTGEVKVGTPATGTLTNAKWQDSYTVNFATGDPIDIIVKRTSGTLVPAMHLLGANGQEINGARADNTYAVASLNQFTPPGPGQYTIVVTRDQDAGGLTSGGYELDVNQGKKQ